VFYVTQRSKAALAERVLRLESADADAGWHALFVPVATLPEPQAKLLAGAHTVVSFLSKPGDVLSENVARLAPGVNLLSLAVSPPAEFAGHVTEHLLSQLAPWPAVSGALEQVLRSVNMRGISAKPPHGNPVLIHPGSGSPRKCWPAERFVSLIERLRADGRAVRVALGEVELERWPPQQVEQLAGVAEVVRPATYLDLLDELMKSGAYVGNDSGPSHLAGIIGLPTVALFGPSNPTHWRPIGPRVRVVQAPALEQIEVSQAYESLRAAAASE
jgi:hypothetical protein